MMEYRYKQKLGNSPAEFRLIAESASDGYNIAEIRQHLSALNADYGIPAEDGDADTVAVFVRIHQRP